MPSERRRSGEWTSRRRVIGTIGAVLTGGVSGCTGRIPGTGPVQLDVHPSVEDNRILWKYPSREGGQNGIGYAAIKAEERRSDEQPPALRLEFNSTIGSIAASEPYTGYQPDWFRFRIRPPTAYESRLQYQVRVEPPGQWENFSTYYDIQGGVREFSVELHDVGTKGTIIIPAVFDPGMNPLPDSLHCSFTVQASRPELLGKTVRVSDQESLDLTDT